MTTMEETRQELEGAIHGLRHIVDVDRLLAAIVAYGDARYLTHPRPKPCGCNPVENLYCLEHAGVALAPKTVPIGRPPAILMTADQAEQLLHGGGIAERGAQRDSGAAKPESSEGVHAPLAEGATVPAPAENLVNHAPNCDCTDSRENFECDTCRLRFGPCMGNGDDSPESCDRCANLKVAEERARQLEAALRTALSHDGTQWQACAACSAARTKFIGWLRDQFVVRDDATTEEFKAAILARLGAADVKGAGGG